MWLGMKHSFVPVVLGCAVCDGQWERGAPAEGFFDEGLDVGQVRGVGEGRGTKAADDEIELVLGALLHFWTGDHCERPPHHGGGGSGLCTCGAARADRNSRCRLRPPKSSGAHYGLPTRSHAISSCERARFDPNSFISSDAPTLDRSDPSAWNDDHFFEKNVRWRERGASAYDAVVDGIQGPIEHGPCAA